jgi:hypothetical protein
LPKLNADIAAMLDTLVPITFRDSISSPILH